MQNMPGQWIARQQQAGRHLCLILDGQSAAREPLLAVRSVSDYRNLYGETVLAECGVEGPVILLLKQMSEPALRDLLQQPENNWGWLGSLPCEDLTGVTRHWRDRLLTGPQGEQSLYRFHDNRTLARALDYLCPDQWPVFLGPLISLCYWHEDRWRTVDNPTPGEYPLPDPVPWLNTPNPNADAILHANILRYLLAEHSEDLVALVEFQDPRVWLSQVLEQARIWQWRGPEQLEFLVVRRLEEATRNSVIRWQPLAGEAPGDHFERVVEQWRLMGKKMGRRRLGVWAVVGMLGLTGCAGKAVDRFTLEVDLPAEFRFIGGANYGPATGEVCTLPRRRGKRPERKIFIASYKPVAKRVSVELPLSEVIEGCPTVLRSVDFDMYAKWGARDTDVGGDLTGFPILDDSDVDESGMPATGVQELHRRCRWSFRTVGPQHAVIKILKCSYPSTASSLSGLVQRDQLPGKTLRMVLTVVDEEEPAVGDNWVAVPGGWKRCKGKNFEDLYAFCNGNTSDFKPIKMPDGRVCDVYPSCK